MKVNLEDYAVRKGDWWLIGGHPQPYSEEKARAIIEACLLLDVPISPMITAEAWLKVVKLALGDLT